MIHATVPFNTMLKPVKRRKKNSMYLRNVEILSETNRIFHIVIVCVVHNPSHPCKENKPAASSVVHESHMRNYETHL